MLECLCHAWCETDLPLSSDCFSANGGRISRPKAGNGLLVTPRNIVLMPSDT